MAGIAALMDSITPSDVQSVMDELPWPHLNRRAAALIAAVKKDQPEYYDELVNIATGKTPPKET